jgi:tetratricopeptide (TPR) repeat protein
MANLEKYKERARKFEAKEQWAKAIEEYVKSIEEMEAAPDADADLTIYNRVGDLYQKVGEGQNAIVYYERAVDKYQETGLDNNAIALCNKVLRIAPGRAQVYLKLGMLFASKGFAAEAKTNLLEYADRMQKAGQLEEAFKALKKFAEMTPGQDEIWSVLAQQARASAKTPDQKERVEKLLGEFEARDRAHQRKSRASRHMLTGEELPVEKPAKKGDLVFLDLEPTPPRKSGPVAAPPAAKAPPAHAVERAEEPTPEVPPLDLELMALAPPEVAPTVPALEIEPTSLAEDVTGGAAPPLELEPTSLAEAPAAEAAPAEPPGEVEWIALEEEAEAEPSAEAAAESAPSRGVMEEEPPAVAEAAEALAPREPEAEEGGAAVAGLPILDIGEPEAPPAGTVPAAADSTLEFLDVGEAVVAAPTVADLEAEVAQHPDDWAAHRRLGEALIEAGRREQGFTEFDIALEGLAQAEDLDGAYAIAEELLRLDPNSVRYHQKRVELAYRQGDRQRLASAYLELADALLRSGEAEKAVAVYQRVLEHDPGNVRARSAIETLAPPAPPTRVAPAAPEPVVATPAGGFIDFGAMLLEDEGPKDTRMRIEDEEPSGDEQKDFQTMLAAFKKGVEANVEEEDFQSHYDLGVAYKEMGLLDEAIAEFQKALRGAEGRLKASEALGLCFFEKGQFTVAETILRRALDLPAHGDAERVGLLYWLGRTQEELGKAPDALAAYNRVFAVDITFQDVSQRVRSLARAGV